MANPKVTLHISGGKKIDLELYPDKAPASCGNFLRLCREGYYNGLCFHRVIEGFMVQGGGFTTDGKELTPAKKCANIPGEFRANGFKGNDVTHRLGVLSMARAQDMNSASSQFFICSADAFFLDGNYAAFGKTCNKESDDAVIEISGVATKTTGHYGDVPVNPVIIEKAEVSE